MATYLRYPLNKAFIRVRGYKEHRATHPGTWYGIDYGVKTGTKVLSTRSGAVNKVVLKDKYAGNTILIQHRDSKGKLINLYSWYAHLSKIYVKAHQTVQKGSLIGLSGATGIVSGPHLHWSILAY